MLKKYKSQETVDPEIIKSVYSTLSTGDLSKIKTHILNKNINTNTVDEHGNTLVHIILEIEDSSIDKNKKLEIINYLFNKGFSIDSSNSENIKPIHIASQKQLVNIVDFLLKNGVDSSFVDNHGMNALNHLFKGNQITCDVQKRKELKDDIENMAEFHDLASFIIKILYKNEIKLYMKHIKSTINQFDDMYRDEICEILINSKKKTIDYINTNSNPDPNPNYNILIENLLDLLNKKINTNSFNLNEDITYEDISQENIDKLDTNLIRNNINLEYDNYKKKILSFNNLDILKENMNKIYDNLSTMNDEIVKMFQLNEYILLITGNTHSVYHIINDANYVNALFPWMRFLFLENIDMVFPEININTNILIRYVQNNELFINVANFKLIEPSINTTAYPQIANITGNAIYRQIPPNYIFLFNHYKWNICIINIKEHYKKIKANYDMLLIKITNNDYYLVYELYITHILTSLINICQNISIIKINYDEIKNKTHLIQTIIKDTIEKTDEVLRNNVHLANVRSYLIMMTKSITNYLKYMFDIIKWCDAIYSNIYNIIKNLNDIIELMNMYFSNLFINKFNDAFDTPTVDILDNFYERKFLKIKNIPDEFKNYINQYTPITNQTKQLLYSNHMLYININNYNTFFSSNGINPRQYNDSLLTKNGKILYTPSNIKMQMQGMVVFNYNKKGYLEHSINTPNLNPYPIKCLFNKNDKIDMNYNGIGEIKYESNIYTSDKKHYAPSIVNIKEHFDIIKLNIIKTIECAIFSYATTFQTIVLQNFCIPNGLIFNTPETNNLNEILKTIITEYKKKYKMDNISKHEIYIIIFKIVNEIIEIFITTSIYNKCVNIANEFYSLDLNKYFDTDIILKYKKDNTVELQSFFSKLNKDIYNKIVYNASETTSENDFIEYDITNNKKYFKIYNDNFNKTDISNETNIYNINCIEINYELFEKLIENGCDINQIDARGETPLFYLIDLLHVDFIKRMNENSKKIKIKNKNNLTPYQYLIKKYDTYLEFVISKNIFKYIDEKMKTTIESNKQIKYFPNIIPMLFSMYNNYFFIKMKAYINEWTFEEYNLFDNLFKIINNTNDELYNNFQIINLNDKDLEKIINNEWNIEKNEKRKLNVTKKNKINLNKKESINKEINKLTQILNSTQDGILRAKINKKIKNLKDDLPAVLTLIDEPEVDALPNNDKQVSLLNYYIKRFIDDPNNTNDDSSFNVYEKIFKEIINKGNILQYDLYNNLWKEYINNNRFKNTSHLHYASILIEKEIINKESNKNTMNIQLINNLYEKIFCPIIFNYNKNPESYDVAINEMLFEIINIIKHIIKYVLFSGLYREILRMIYYLIISDKSESKIVKKVNNEMKKIIRESHLEQYVMNEMPLLVIKQILQIFKKNDTESDKRKTIDDIFYNIINIIQKNISVVVLNEESIEKLNKLFENYKKIMIEIIPLMKNFIDNYNSYIINNSRYIAILNELYTYE
jgi:hypothetical protein